MAIDQTRIKRHIADFNFNDLFIEELGWNHPPRSPQTLAIDGQQYVLSPMAEKAGLQVFACKFASDDQLPDANKRLKIERQLTPLVAEHLLVFLTPTTQFWQWARREPNAPIKLFKEIYRKGGSVERLSQKLAMLAFSLEEEARGISILEPSARARQAFFVKDATAKSFYKQFEKEHEAFLKQIKGIDDEESRKWYASLMLNRLMFVYFIQRKGFLDGEQHYLKKKLVAVKSELGEGKFHSFYRSFLLRLFHDGLGGPQPHSSQLIKLIGRVPYLNGGLFEVHKLEEGKTGALIEIPDKAFKRIFDFFDEWDWHLENRPQRNQSEINPDVLGYIFEQYINNKQMGAYYTKEDITEYISKNTIIPFLLDRAAQAVAIAFKPTEAASVWRHLQQNPDRYIYEAVRKGVIDDKGNVMELPAAIAAGLDDVSKRDGWNKSAADGYALPTETWREHVARRKRCLELRAKLTSGEIHSVNDLITWNLDIRQFAQDVILQTDDAALVRAFYRAIAGRVPEKSNEHFEHGLSVLDPTCGSGAFLFAALNVLQPLYEACLDRMEAFVAEADQSGKSKSHEDFRRVLAQIKEHPNRDYFILKTIIITNLYGVDIMPEAIEICKLRLFLKLAAQVERDESKSNYGLEPLPDIDFNIRAGNTLVGFTDRAAVEAAFDGEQQFKLGFESDEKALFNEEAEAAEREFEAFRLQQTKLHGAITPKDKAALRARLKKLADKLDVFLAHEYGVKTDKPLLFEAWRKSYQPFHWYTEFFGIIKSGGFDVVIGNPPYVEVSDLKGAYRIKGLGLLETGNLYSLCYERFTQLLRANGRNGVIVPISSISTPRMLSLMQLSVNSFSPLFVSNFAVRPGKLFNGVDMNLTILIGMKRRERATPQIWSTKYLRWHEEARPALFSSLSYVPSSLQNDLCSIAKVGMHTETDLLRKIASHPALSIHLLNRADSSADVVYYHSGGRYFRKCFREQLSNEYKPLILQAGAGDVAICLLSSSFYYWFWLLMSDCYHVTKGDVLHLPLPKSLLKDESVNKLAKRLLTDLFKNAETRDRNRADGSQRKEVNFKVGLSKPIIDEIDRLLARHYDFTDEELDFIINYDIKYRMGRDGEE